MGRLRSFVDSIRHKGEVWRWWPFAYRPHTYLVSNFGRVIRAKLGRYELLTLTRRRNKYVKLWLKRFDGSTLHFLHQLVLETFRGLAKSKQVCRHRDGKRHNNRLSNLVWGTQKQNVADSILHGVHTIGLQNGRAKLSEQDIRNIFTDKRPYRAIALDYQIHVNQIKKLRTGKTYVDITKPLSRKVGHSNHGENRPQSKLTEADVRAIRVSAERNVDLAVKYGVSKNAIGKIKLRQTWAYVV